jgi:hypothetical protein
MRSTLAATASGGLLIDGASIIVYQHKSTRTLMRATLMDGQFRYNVLDQAAGAAALQVDRCGRQHVVYQRNAAPESPQGLGLTYARVGDGALVDVKTLPLGADAILVHDPERQNNLSFVVTPEGHQHVAAEVRGADGVSRLYYARR